MMKQQIDETDVVLRLYHIGYRGKIDPSYSIELFNWLYRNYSIAIDISPQNYCCDISFENTMLIRIVLHKDRTDKELFFEILRNVLYLWKCKDFKLEGPSIENYYYPDSEWT